MFCREALAELAGLRQQLQAAGTQLAFVHMGTAQQGAELFARYGLGDVPQFSDRDCTLYRAFGLKRAPLGRFLRRDVLGRGLAGLWAGHGIGRIIGDGLRLPGAFLVHRGEVLRSYRPESPANRPDYATLAACPLPPSGEGDAEERGAGGSTRT